MTQYNIDVLGEVVKEAIEKELLRLKDTSWVERSQEYFHPSTIGYCPRATVMQRLRIKEPAHDARVQNIFETGHKIHEKLQDILRRTGLLVKDEYALQSPEHNMRGHTDGIASIYVPDLGGIMAIVEIKSCSMKSWKWIVGEKSMEGHGPDKKHVWQVQLYMYMTGCNYAVIIYENKNDQRIHCFVVKRDPDLIDEILLPRVDLINQCIEDKVLPPRDAEHMPDPSTGMLPFECRFCDLRIECEEEERRQAAREDPEEPIDLIEMAAQIMLEDI